MSKNNYWVLLLKGENEQIFTPWPECEKNELIKPEEILPMLLRISLRGKAFCGFLCIICFVPCVDKKFSCFIMQHDNHLLTLS